VSKSRRQNIKSSYVLTETGYEKLRKAFPNFHEDCDPTHKEIQVIAGIDVKTISEIRTKVKGKNKSTLDKLFSAYNLDPDETTDYELKSKSTNSQKETSALAQVDNQNNNPADNQKNIQLSIQKFCCQEVVDKVEEIAQEHLQVFVGRETDLRRLDQFLVNHESGLMLVTAGAGFGKSALLANWRQKQLSKNYFVAYHCFNYRYETTRSLENAYRHLLAQLSNHYQLNLHSLPNNEIELRDRLYSSIKDIVANREHPCIFLIDSLDEADSPLERPFPPRLPEGVFVIASCRVDSDEVPSYLQTWKEVTKSTLILKRLNRSAIQEWLSHYRNEVLDRYFDDSNFVDKIYELTKGFPLYIRYLIEDLALASKNGEELEEVLEQTSKGFDQYVAKQINDLDNLGLPELHRKFFALLTVAKGELSGTDIKGITEIKDRDLRILQQTPKIARWLKINGRQFSFTHPLLAEKFAQSLGDEAEEILQELLNYCSRWSEHFSTYALRLYAQHLLEMERFDDLQNLAKDSEYAIAQSNHLPSEPNLNLRTVQIALESAAARDDAISMAECIFVYARRKTEVVSNKLPLNTLREVGFKSALQVADLYEPEVQVLWYLLLAWEAHEKGYEKDAQEILQQLKIKKLPRFIDRVLDERNPFLYESGTVIFLLLKVHDIDIDIFKEVYPRLLDDMSIARMCCRMIEENSSLTKLAIEIANNISDSKSQEYAYGWIGEKLAKNGCISDALYICNTYLAPFTRTDASDIGSYHISEIQKEIAIFYSKNQEFSKFLSVLKKIKWNHKKYETLKGAMENLAKANRFDLISKAIEHISYRRSVLLVDQAKELYKVGQFSESSQILDSTLDLLNLEEKDGQLYLTQYIAEGYIFIGDEKKALEVINNFSGENSDYHQSIILAEAAKKLTKSGKQKSASEFINIAFKQANNCQDPETVKKQIENKFKELSDTPESNLIKLQSQDNVNTVSHKILNSLETPFIEPEEIDVRRQTIFSDFYTRTNDFTKAIEHANFISYRHQKLRVIIKIASIQYKKQNSIESIKNFERVFELSQSLDFHEKEWFVDLIILSLSKLGEFKKALELIEEIEDKWYRLRPLSTLGIESIKKNKKIFAEKILKKSNEILLEIYGEHFNNDLNKIYFNSEAYIYNIKSFLATIEGKYEEALELSDCIRDYSINSNRNKAKTFIAEELARTGKLDEAIQLLENFLCKGWSDFESDLWLSVIISLSEIANLQAESGDLLKAKSIFKIALTKANMITQEKNRSQALASIICFQIRAGFESWAMETLEIILNDRSYHLLEISFKFADKQDKKNFKKILFSLSINIRNAYDLCLELMHLYPEQAEDLINVIP
jgi:AAA ATPase domain